MLTRRRKPQSPAPRVLTSSGTLRPGADVGVATGTVNAAPNGKRWVVACVDEPSLSRSFESDADDNGFTGLQRAQAWVATLQAMTPSVGDVYVGEA
jgi:hypothetical protein